MYLSLLFLTLLYISLFLVTNCTSKDIILEVNKEKEDDKYFLKRYFLYLPFSLIYVILIYIIGKRANIFSHNDMIVWLAMNIIYSHSLIVTFITDETVKRINRHLLRFSYILNFVGIIFLNYGKDNFKISMIVQAICLLILFLGFIFTDIGASDFRCFFITIPTMIYLYGSSSIFTVLGMLIMILIYFYIKKKKMGRKAEVPIGTPILLSNIIFSLFAYLFI